MINLHSSVLYLVYVNVQMIISLTRMLIITPAESWLASPSGVTLTQARSSLISISCLLVGLFAEGPKDIH